MVLGCSLVYIKNIYIHTHRDMYFVSLENALCQTSQFPPLTKSQSHQQKGKDGELCSLEKSSYLSHRILLSMNAENKSPFYSFSHVH